MNRHNIFDRLRLNFPIKTTLVCTFAILLSLGLHIDYVEIIKSIKPIDYLIKSSQKIDKSEGYYDDFQTWLKNHDDKQNLSHESKNIVEKMDSDQQVNQYILEKKLNNKQEEIKQEVAYKNAQDNYIVHVGYWGDLLSAISSIVALLLSVVTLFFVYMTFMKEGGRVKKQRFEDHFFHLLAIHRDNVKTMKIEHKSFDFRLKYDGCDESHKAILKMFRELMEMIEITPEEKENIRIFQDANQRTVLVYLCFYYGFGGRSGNILEKKLKDCSEQQVDILKENFKDNKEVKDNLEELEQEFGQLRSFNLVSKITLNQKIDSYYKDLPRKKITEDAELKYKAAGGHQTRLDHYFANLLFCFELIEKQKKSMLKSDLDVYKKELVSQLNVYEKILLIIHSSSPLGKKFQKYVLEYDIKSYIPDGMIKEEEFNITSYFARLKQERKRNKCFTNLAHL